MEENDTQNNKEPVVSPADSSVKSKQLLVRILLIVLIFAGIVAVSYFILYRRARLSRELVTAPGEWDPDADPNVNHPTAEVVLDEDGFTPNELNIEEGTVVIWVNESGEEASVYSTPEADHSDNPLLNLGSLADGDKFSLLFDGAGTYKYLNGSAPSETGMITVSVSSGN